MSQVVFRANLSAAAFPFLTENQGRTVIVRQYDHTHAPTVASQKDMDGDTGIPQILFCENILPTGDGFESVDYNVSILKNPWEPTRVFVQIVSFRDFFGNPVFIGRTTSNHLYKWNISQPYWMPLQAPTPLSSIVGEMSVARVAGETYVFIQYSGLFKWSSAADGVLLRVIPTGLQEINVIGIWASQGYLLAHTATDIAWGSTIDPTDMAPSLATGAGGGSVEGAKGNIVTVKPHTSGFTIYTTQNSILGIYSGNARYPFNFREVAGSSGIGASNQVAADDNSSTHFVWTTNGIQQITAIESKHVFPEASDFLHGRRIEYFDHTLNVPKLATSYGPNQPQKIHLKLVGDRYLVISYNIFAVGGETPAFQYALVFDLALERFGKLKIEHVGVVDFLSTHADVNAGRGAIGFLQADGQVVTINASRYIGTYVASNILPVLLLGKFQFVRSRLLQLDRVEVENVFRDSLTPDSSPPFTCATYAAADGKTLESPVSGFEHQSTNLVRNFLFRAVGVNHTLLFKGKFHITSVVLHFNTHGRR